VALKGVSGCRPAGDNKPEMELMTTADRYAHRPRQLLIAGLIVVFGALLAHFVHTAGSALIQDVLLVVSFIAAWALCGRRPLVPTAVEITRPTVAKRRPQ
jgi:hypothetical protein